LRGQKLADARFDVGKNGLWRYRAKSPGGMIRTPRSPKGLN
jgi:hypothetical protein